MCLRPDSDIKIAEKDLVVYKVVRPTDQKNVYYSPYFGATWEIGKTITVASFGDDDEPTRRFKKKLPSDYKYGLITIGRGLHAYVKKSRAVVWTNPYKIMRCTIPKGTPYILGRYGDIVALALRADKIVRR